MRTWQTLASSVSVFGAVLLLVSVGLSAKRLLRFCRHKRMGWPIRQGGYTYQACLDCGIQRLFDERPFQSYGDYRYDLTRIVRGPGSDPETLCIGTDRDQAPVQPIAVWEVRASPNPPREDF